MPSVPDIVGALTADAIDVAGAVLGTVVPGAATAGATVGALFESYLRRRAEEAQEVLLDELRKGERPPEAIPASDGLIAALLRYRRMANEGVARPNLRLLAKAIAGQLRRGTLVADEFSRYADILASLSRDEIILIAAMWRSHVAGKETTATTPDTQPFDPWKAARSELVNSKVFPDEEYVSAIAARAQRTGLITAVSAYGGLVYRITPIFLEITALVDFQDALLAEGVGL